MREVVGERAIVLAIHPQHARKIYAGEKTAELRRASPVHRIHLVFIYETAPVSAITGMMLVSEVSRASPFRTWKEFSRRLCITEREFHDYLRGCRAATVYEVSKALRFPKEVPLVKTTRLRRPPQSYSYLDRDMTSRVLHSVSSMSIPFQTQSTLSQWVEHLSDLNFDWRGSK